MADAVVQLPADGVGKKLDAETLTVGANTVFRERIQLSGAAATDIAPVTAADGVLVNLGTNNDVTVSGPVTANAGTNLNTSALALEAGNLATAVASLSVMDDWDESDRAKVNPIAGQVGVQGGAGAVSALTQRVVVATDQTAIPVSGTVTITGAATEVKQDTQITHLATIAGDTTAIETAVQIMDDWDEADRAKVNPIAGQAGVQGASGVVTALTQRVVLATDVALPTGTNSVGQVTANAGTNLNTSTLALEAGGNLAGAATSLAIVDDWDESDRAKVNLIVGQAGVAAGVGASGATVQRVVQANDSGKTILSAGGSAAGSGNNTLVAAGTNKLKVIAFSLTTLSTTAMTCIFQSGASGTELWRVVLQAITGSSTGANLSIALPGYLFATASATLLNLNLSSANAVHWSVTYIDEA